MSIEIIQIFYLKIQLTHDFKFWQIYTVSLHTLIPCFWAKSQDLCEKEFI